MLSKNRIKFIKSLESKKVRAETGLFLAEGNKLVADLLPFFDCELLLAKSSWMATQGDLKAKEIIVAEENDIEKASLLKNPQDVLAVFVQPTRKLDKIVLANELALVLDGIQDPGNLGTIVRLADWFGISTVICSPDTADIYNPKTVQATMGGLARVSVFYESLPELLDGCTGGRMGVSDTPLSPTPMPIYGTFLDGNTIYNEKLTSTGLIIMGNEGNGIRPETAQHVTNRLYIPNFPLGTPTTESLNVATATAITLSEFRRRM
ncbi:MAG: RNA methyltransferase [Candidatus Symbiothrix sp.]|jgi:TrmH family RNA methyltransferase|nr:RNA methyltransferase [Candidatus Symbiothrix sp.]